MLSEELAILHEVQQADAELARLRKALVGLDTGDELAAQVEQAQQELGDLREQHRGTEKDSMDSDLELKTLQEKKSKFEGQLYGGAVRNPRQLSDLQREVQLLSREIGKVEDRLLELMEALEAESAGTQRREGELADMQERLAAVRAKHESAGSRLRQEIAELEEKRSAKAGQVGPELLKRYERIRERSGNLGLVKVSGTTCPGCQVALPSELLKRLGAGRQALTCENCGRLLFFPEGED